MRANQKLFMAMVAIFILGMAGIVYAGSNPIPFDPSGSGSGTLTSIFDWKPGNALSIDLTSPFPGTLQNGDILQVLYQANAGTMYDANNVAYFTNGNNGQYFAAVAGYEEKASLSYTLIGSTFVPTGATFSYVPNSPSFFYIYALNAAGDDLAGTGFTTGKMIMSATIVSTGFGSNFSLTLDSNNNIVISALDEFGTNNYPAITSVNGGGRSSVDGLITYADPAYFPGVMPLVDTDFTFFTTEQDAPYITTNPSAAMSSDGIANGDVVGAGSVGPVNGLFLGPNVTNFIFQADSSQSFQAPIHVIPEPSTLLLLGIGIVGLAGLRKKV